MSSDTENLRDPLEWEEWLGDWPFFMHAVAGSASGVMEHMSMFPVDTVKTRMQAFEPSTHFIHRKKGFSFSDVGRPLSNGLNYCGCDTYFSNFFPKSLLNYTFHLSIRKKMGFGVFQEGVSAPEASLPISRCSTSVKNMQMGQGQSTAFKNVGCSIKSGTGSGTSGISAVSNFVNHSSVHGSALGLRLHRSPQEGAVMKNTGRMYSPGILEAAQSIYREGGLVRFYRGASAMFLGCIPAHACYFTAYESCRSFFEKANRTKNQKPNLVIDNREDDYSKISDGKSARLSSGELLTCGALSVLCHDLVLTPVDVVKQRLQLGCFRNSVDCIIKTWRNEGFTAFTRSLPVSMLLNIPNGAALVCVNDSLKTILIEDFSCSPNILVYFICAGISGGVAGFITNPLDVVKTRMQTQQCHLLKDNKLNKKGVLTQNECRWTGSCRFATPPKYQSLFGTVYTIWMEEGTRGFLRGIGTRVALGVPATAICWGTYETLKSIWATVNG